MGLEVAWVLTCEHASNTVPKKYAKYFAGGGLEAHTNFDIGAKEYSKWLAEALFGTLFLGKYNRLFIDLNRSEKNRALFSEYTKNFSEEEKKNIVKTFYKPFRKGVRECIAEALSQHSQVIHLSCHSFTPEMNGHIREMDLGLLYDPRRKKEKQFCEALKRDLQQNTSMVVQLNAPYRGISDGHTKELRLCFSPKEYIGIEIEVNQRVFTKSFRPLWENVWFPSLIASLLSAERVCL